ncbi:MAG: addiction module protein [Verrucomicrobiota bacterium]
MSHQILESILSLPVEEKREIAERLWEDLGSDSLTEAQQAELDRRLAEHRLNPTAGDSLSSVLERIRQA